MCGEEVDERKELEEVIACGRVVAKGPAGISWATRSQSTPISALRFSTYCSMACGVREVEGRADSRSLHKTPRKPLSCCVSYISK